jgi:FkbM family methyltransferase
MEMAGHVCPSWLGYFHASPVRRFYENPDKLLNEIVRPGMTVLDVGCAMGFFTLPAARLVGPEGRVIAVDLQEKMIRSLKRRVKRAGLADQIETRTCSEHTLGVSDLNGTVDLVLALYVVHEVPDRDRLMSELYRATRLSGHLLVVEPKGHVSADDFAQTVAAAERVGFATTELSLRVRGRGALFVRK